MITPSLNAAQTISACIESVRRQSVPCEHILIDGGSSDQTLARAGTFEPHFSHIISETDEGMYAAMNKGIQLASGEIVGILNADDSFASADVIEKVALAFGDISVDACYGDLDYVSADDDRHVLRRWRSGSFDRKKFFNGWMPPHPALFLRKTVYQNLGLFRTDLGTSADYEFMLRIFVKHKLNAAYIPQVLVNMQSGGASNKSVLARWRANRNDKRAWSVNDLRPRPWTIVAKPLRKLGQWWL